MYKSIGKIRNLKKEKQAILRTVYQDCNPDYVYKQQKTLAAMSISIFTDAANAIIPTLQDDGVSNVVWPSIALRLNKLSFIGVPTASELREKYKKSIETPTVIEIEGARPKPRTEKELKKISTQTFLALLAGQGIVVPLLVSFVGGSKWALVKIMPCALNTALMVIEVVKYFDLCPPKKRKKVFASAKQATDSVDYEAMCKQAIQEVYADNCKKLNEWFDELEKITVEEIEKALDKREG